AEVHLVGAPRRFGRQHVAGEDFETRETSLDQLRHVFERIDRRWTHEVDVKAVVNQRLTSPARRPLLEGLLRGGTRVDLTEVDVRCDSAKGHADGVRSEERR